MYIDLAFELRSLWADVAVYTQGTALELIAPYKLPETFTK